MGKKSFFKAIIFGVILSPIFISCSQPEGLGGNSHINGVLIERFYNEDFSVLQSEEPAKDEDVFLLFGNDSIVGEKTATSFYGNFQFKYLWPGNYHLYYFSDDSISTNQRKEEKINEITLEKNTTLNLDTLYKNTILDWNEGAATITGKVRIINYTSESSWPNLDPSYEGVAQDVDVYLVYNNHKMYDDRIRTMGDGSFTFSNLLKGDYQVFLYTENMMKNDVMIIKNYNVTIDQVDQVVTLNDKNDEGKNLDYIRIEKH